MPTRDCTSSRYLPHSRRQPTRVLSNLGFTPNSLTSLQIGDDTLIAAGGQDTEIHLSYHTPSSSTGSAGRRRRTRVRWEFEDNLQGSINNSVLLTSLSLSRSNESSVDPRVGISNNDGSVRLYDVPMRVSSARRNRKLQEVGEVRLDVPVNHCESLSITLRTFGAAGVYYIAVVSFSTFNTRGIRFAIYDNSSVFTCLLFSTCSMPASRRYSC